MGNPACRLRKSQGKSPTSLATSRVRLPGAHDSLQGPGGAINFFGCLSGDFPRIWGTILEVPIIGIIVFWCLCWGPPIWGNYRVHLGSRIGGESGFYITSWCRPLTYGLLKLDCGSKSGT